MFDEATGRPQIDEKRWEGEEYVSSYVNGSRSYFDNPEIIEKIDQQSLDTLAWMRLNEESYTKTGDLRYEPWWHGAAPTDQRILKHAGDNVLRNRVYGHGMMHFLRELEKRRVIDGLNKRIVGLIYDPITPDVLDQLVIHLFHEKMQDGITLRHLNELLGYGENTKTAKGRDRYLGDLAGLGLVRGRANAGWDIELGAVAKVFYSQINSVILDEFAITYQEPKK